MDSQIDTATAGEGVAGAGGVGGGRARQWAEHPVRDSGGQVRVETRVQWGPAQTRGRDTCHEASRILQCSVQVMSGSKRGSQLFTVMSAGSMVPNEVKWKSYISVMLLE